MDLPILNQLEKIYPNQDTGAEAIRKLIKNQNLIEQGIKDTELMPGPQGPTGATGPSGADGSTPFIGSNGNWWIGDIDTGVSASGAQDLTNLKNQVNALSSQLSNINIYTSLTQINSSFTINTPIADIYNALPSPSILIYAVSGNSTVYPASYGECMIRKSASNRDSMEFTDTLSNRKYIGTCHTSIADVFSGWDELVKASSLSALEARIADLETQIINTLSLQKE